MAVQKLRKAKLLRTKKGYKDIYICPDRSVEERRAFKKLSEELKEKRKAEPNRVHFIRNNKIVSSDKNSVSASSEDFELFHLLHHTFIFSHFCLTILFCISVIISGPCNCGHILLCSTMYSLPSDFTDRGNNFYEFIL